MKHPKKDEQIPLLDDSYYGGEYRNSNKVKKTEKIIVEKYPWKIGSPLPRLDQHSKVKHTIIEEYIKRYIQTLMLPANIPEIKLTIVDGFCGGGLYEDESGAVVDGSPLIALRAVAEARAKINVDRINERKVDADYIFVDIAPDHTDYLNYVLKAKREEGNLNHSEFEKINVMTGSFESSLPSIFKRIKDKKGGERVIFILDQYSYKDVPIGMISSIIKQMKSAEVILTFNVDNLVTYISEHEANQKAISNINLDKYIPWSSINLIKQDSQWRAILQKYLAEGIKKESGAEHMTLFFVKPFGSSTWGYWLIHLSNTYRVHDVMKTLHWENGNQFGHELGPGIFVLGYDANDDITYTGQNSMTFDSKLAQLSVEVVEEHFGKYLYDIKKPILLKNLFSQFISSSTAAEYHLQNAVRDLHSSKDIVILDKDGNRRYLSKSYALTDIIEPRRQIVFDFSLKSKIKN